MLSILLGCLLGYCLGSIPTAYLLLRWRRRIGLRTAGSGNVGALNSFVVSRSWRIGLMVLVVDVAKGAASVLMASALWGGSLSVQESAGLGAVLGHLFPVWLQGRGGRGLATAAGVVLPVAPQLVLLWGVSWLPGYLLTRDVNVGSAVACVVALAVVLLVPGVHSTWLTPGADLRIASACLFTLLLVRLIGPVGAYLRARDMR